MQQNLKILLLNTQMEVAGAQKAMLTLARGLQNRGHNVMIATMYDKADYVSFFRQHYGVNIIDLKMKVKGITSPFKKIKNVFIVLRRLSELIIREKFDVVQTFTHYSNILGTLTAYVSGARIRVSSQRSSLKGAPGWLLFIDRLVTNSFLTDKMVAVSEGTRRFSIDFQKIKPEKLITIHNSIDLDRFLPEKVSFERLNQLRQELGFSDCAIFVIIVARLHIQKGHRFMIEAIPTIRKVFPDTHFLFVGEGELRQNLMDRAKQAGVVDAVHFLGMRPDIPELLALSDIFVLPSLWEGLPNSVLEAMAMGTPVIATNVDGCPELIQDSQTGILVPPADPAALTQAIVCLIKNAEFRQKLADTARHWVVENFSEKKNINAFERLYKSLMAAKG